MPSLLRHTNLITQSIHTYEEFKEAMKNPIFVVKNQAGVWSLPETSDNVLTVELVGQDLVWRNFYLQWSREMATP